MEEEDRMSARLLPHIEGFTKAWKRGDFETAKKHRMDIEKIAGKGAMPFAPTDTELACPVVLAKTVSCASRVIKRRARVRQPVAVCRASLKFTECEYCPTLPQCIVRRR